MAIALTLWKVFRPTILNQNIAAMISGAGVGALLGASFGIVPSLLFLIILCVYDFVSVFITKHMITLAKIDKDTDGLYNRLASQVQESNFYWHKRSKEKVPHLPAGCR